VKWGRTVRSGAVTSEPIRKLLALVDGLN
jgi:hypothetical protein